MLAETFQATENKSNTSTKHHIHEAPKFQHIITAVPKFLNYKGKGKKISEQAKRLDPHHKQELTAGPEIHSQAST